MAFSFVVAAVDGTFTSKTANGQIILDALALFLLVIDHVFVQVYD